jgi:hypothetical protein
MCDLTRCAQTTAFPYLFLPLCLLTACGEMLVVSTGLMNPGGGGVAHAVERNGWYRKQHLRAQQGLYEFCHGETLRVGVPVDDARRSILDWMSTRASERIAVEAPLALTSNETLLRVQYSHGERYTENCDFYFKYGKLLASRTSDSKPFTIWVPKYDGVQPSSIKRD